PVSERPPSSLSPTIPETEWVVPNPISPVTDWRPWPYVPVHSPIRDPTPELESPPTPPAQTFIFKEPLIRAFNINEPIYSELCHEFYSTYEFNEVCADDELKTKKIIKFRLGGRAHSLTLLEFAHRLGLYHVEELNEEGFDVYFQGGLRSDEHFNGQEYWLSIS
ncbi:hypothetical protein Tco_1289972, partial [Tanacetum coccineum]